jgi:predicted nuclease of predicted toxin-antitoxin system
VKLLLDENVSAGAAGILRERGFDVVHAREVGLAAVADSTILEWCLDSGRIIVTLDADFHAQLAMSGAREPSVVRIRVEGLRDTEMAALIEQVTALVSDDLVRGSAVSVNATSIRVRALPLISTIE